MCCVRQSIGWTAFSVRIVDPLIVKRLLLRLAGLEVARPRFAFAQPMAQAHTFSSRLPGTGAAIGFGPAVVRRLAHLLLDAPPCYAGFLWPLWDEHRQTFADKIATTVVVKGR